jgi:hypothetical protein
MIYHEIAGISSRKKLVCSVLASHTVTHFDQYNEQDDTDNGKKYGQNIRGDGSARRAIVRAVIV